MRERGERGNGKRGEEETRESDGEGSGALGFPLALLRFAPSPLLPFPFSLSYPLPLFLSPVVKNVEARMRSPLRIRASTMATHFTKAPSVTKLDRDSRS